MNLLRVSSSSTRSGTGEARAKKDVVLETIHTMPTVDSRDDHTHTTSSEASGLTIMSKLPPRSPSKRSTDSMTTSSTSYDSGIVSGYRAPARIDRSVQPTVSPPRTPQQPLPKTPPQIFRRKSPKKSPWRKKPPRSPPSKKPPKPSKDDAESPNNSSQTDCSTTSADTSAEGDASMYTERAGNVSTDEASVLLNSMVCLSTVNTQRDARLHRVSSWGKLLMASPERLVRDSLLRHFGFHLSRLEEENNEENNSERPLPTVEDMENITGDQADEWVRQCLHQSSLTGAISVYKVLLEKQKNEPLERADTLSRLAVLCLADGQHAAAMDYCKTAVNLHKDHSRPLQVARGAVLAGLVHFGINRIGGALKAWRQAMQLACMSCGYEHVYTAVLLCNIGVLHYEAGDLTSSLRNLEESLELQQTLLRTAPVHVENALFQMATTMGNLAMACERNLEHDRAVALLDESLQLYGSIECGDTADAVRAVTENLTRIGGDSARRQHPFSIIEESSSWATCESDRSATLFGNSDGVPNRRMAARLTMQLSDNHDYLLLGPLSKQLTPEQQVRETVLYWFGRKMHDSVPFVSYDQTLTDETTRPRESMPVDVDGDYVVNAELFLNKIYRQAMKHMDHHEIADALELFDSALKSHRAKYGNIHHLVGTALHNIGMVHLFAKEYDRALVVFGEAVAVRTEALGPDHPDVQVSMMKIGLIHLALSDLVRARSVFWEIKDKFLDVLGYGHPQLAKIMNNIGVVTYHCGDLTSAYRAFEIAYQYQRRWNEEAARESEVIATATANTLCNIGYLYAEKGELVEALRMFEEALELQEKFLPDNDSRMKIVRENIQYLVGPNGIMPAFAAIGCGVGDESPLSSLFSFDMFRGGCS